MAVEILMPQLSDTMKSGKILAWKKKKGDAVSRGDILAEVETEKANLEIESFHSGVLLEIFTPEGDNAEVGKAIAVVGQTGESVVKQSQAPIQTTPAASPTPSSAPANGAAQAHAPLSSSGRVKASPLAKKLAEQSNVNLETVRGSGPDGRIVKRDIESAATTSPSVSTPAARPAREAPAPRPQASSGPVDGKLIPLSRMRETIARRMQESVTDNPHFYVTTAVNMTQTLKLREILKSKAGFEAVNVNHFIIKAVANALAQEPRVNRAYRDGNIFEPAHINVGIITAVDDGLLIPVIRDADQLSLRDIAFEAKAAIDRARAGRPTSSDLSGGTFSISNMGMFDVESFTAIINPGQGGVLAVSSVKETPIVEKGQMIIGYIMKVTVSVDHRVIDGVMAAKFLQFFKESLENPALMLL